ncbi:ABC transporter permease [Natrialbaceae archaeon AArc-T1-2]|uniref:ABC transporter permease n=1 Tax=Natrialbaceae archaeon AArc-T1-2 TaxID=3053904 RepID=UPI00255A97AE|nr:ABC transporter permease [Natrialbaceae archaeon AArc-T1-2]WIV66545.1 ABC transporter permease [Natrialbaceae archaeon AArc-T1-2]
MATKKPDQFDQVDWDELSTGTRTRLSLNTKLAALTVIPVLALSLYDWQFVGPRETIAEQLGAPFGLAGVVETAGLAFDPDPVDYMFAVTLLLFLWYIVVPMVQNPRLTTYYWNEFKRNRPAVASLVWLGFVFVGGLLGPLFVDEPATNVREGHQPPAFWEINAAHTGQCVGDVVDGACQGTWQYPLGTTRAGEDVFAYVVHGMTVSMQIAFIVTFIVVVVGISVGTISAYAGGWVDELLMRATDVVLSFPTLIMFLLIVYIYGTTLGVFIIIFAAFGWGGTARYVRSKALSVSEAEFIKASKMSGASLPRVVVRHVIPNTASSIITQLTLLIPGFLLFEAQLAFLELGADVPSWGRLIEAGRHDLSFAPWIVLVPGFVLFLTILAFNFVGDALLDALNPEANAEVDRTEAIE